MVLPTSRIYNTWLRQCSTPSKELHKSVLCRHWMLSRRLPEAMDYRDG